MKKTVKKKAAKKKPNKQAASASQTAIDASAPSKLVAAATKLLNAALAKIADSQNPITCVAQGRIEGAMWSLVVAVDLLETGWL